MLKVICATDAIKTQREEVVDALGAIVDAIKSGDLSANGFVLGLYDTSDHDGFVYSTHYHGKCTTALAMLRIGEHSLMQDMGLYE